MHTRCKAGRPGAPQIGRSLRSNGKRKVMASQREIAGMVGPGKLSPKAAHEILSWTLNVRVSNGRISAVVALRRLVRGVQT